MKNNLPVQTSQHKTKNSIDTYFMPISILTVSNLLETFKNLSKSRKRVLNQIIKFCSYYKNVFPSQRTIAQDVGLCRQEVNEALQEIELLGFMSSNYYHRRTKSYRIAPFFHNPFIRSAFLYLLPALSMLPIFSSPSYFRQKADTNLVKNNLVINSLLTDSKIGATDDQTILKKRELLKKEELKRERMTTNVNKLFKEHEIPQEIYEANKLKGERKSIVLINSRDGQVSKEEQQREMSKLISAIKVPEGYNKILITQAKRFAEQVQQGKVSASIALRKLANLKKEVPPAAVESCKQWMNTPEGREIMSILASS